MSDRVCVFVDGENFRHNIVDLFETFAQEDYLPKQADWSDFYDWLVKQVSTDAVRVRTYWYVIRGIDFFPYKFPDAAKEPDKLERLLSKEQGYSR